MVRLHSPGVQGAGTILNPRSGRQGARLNHGMTDQGMIAMNHRTHATRRSSTNDLLVFAPPMMIGFIGNPLALGDALPRRRLKKLAKKNWAKRRAYDA